MRRSVLAPRVEAEVEWLRFERMTPHRRRFGRRPAPPGPGGGREAGVTRLGKRSCDRLGVPSADVGQGEVALDAPSGTTHEQAVHAGSSSSRVALPRLTEPPWRTPATRPPHSASSASCTPLSPPAAVHGRARRSPTPARKRSARVRCRPVRRRRRPPVPAHARRNRRARTLSRSRRSTPAASVRAAALLRPYVPPWHRSPRSAHGIPRGSHGPSDRGSDRRREPGVLFTRLTGGGFCDPFGRVSVALMVDRQWYGKRVRHRWTGPIPADGRARRCEQLPDGQCLGAPPVP